MLPAAPCQPPSRRLTDPAGLCTLAPSRHARKPMSNPDETLGQLEQSLAELEALVEQLETGDLSLEQALKEFERGVKLTRQCQNALKEADGKPEPFEAEEPEE
jgi:exodeoxyribonuclease VII small subunit